MNPITILVGAAFIIALFVSLFLIFRDFTLWYFKLDRIVELLEQIEKNTNKNISKQKSSDSEVEIES